MAAANEVPATESHLHRCGCSEAVSGRHRLQWSDLELQLCWRIHYPTVWAGTETYRHQSGRERFRGADNWQRPASCFVRYAIEAHSTLCGGNGLTVFCGMARPVAAPQTGPATTPGER
jgi:hypothetical protein